MMRRSEKKVVEHGTLSTAIRTNLRQIALELVDGSFSRVEIARKARQGRRQRPRAPQACVGPRALYVTSTNCTNLRGVRAFSRGVHAPLRAAHLGC